MRLKTSFAIVSLSLTQCASMPNKPVLEKCHISAPTVECVCGLTDKSEEVVWHPLEYCDKATAYRPQENEKLNNYVDALEAALKQALQSMSAFVEGHR